VFHMIKFYRPVIALLAFFFLQTSPTDNELQIAKPIFQKLGLEAQQLVGIANPEIIRKLPKDTIDYEKITGRCNSGKILVNEDAFEKYPLDARLTLIHESIHKKQFDLQSKRFKILNNEKYSHIEQEAYMEAARLCNCWVCSTLYALRMPKKPAQYYQPSQDDYLPTIQQQKQSNALCSEHSQTSLAFRIAILELLLKQKKTLSPEIA